MLGKKYTMLELRAKFCRLSLPLSGTCHPVPHQSPCGHTTAKAWSYDGCQWSHRYPTQSPPPFWLCFHGQYGHLGLVDNGSACQGFEHSRLVMVNVPPWISSAEVCFRGHAEPGDSQWPKEPARFNLSASFTYRDNEVSIG